MKTLKSPEAYEVKELAERGYLWAHFDLAVRLYTGRGFRKNTDLAKKFMRHALYASNVNVISPHSNAVHQELSEGHPYLNVENLKTLLGASILIEKSPLALLQRNRIFSVDGSLLYDEGVSGLSSYEHAYKDLQEVCKFSQEEVSQEFLKCAETIPDEFKLTYTEFDTEPLLNPITQARQLLHLLKEAVAYNNSEEDIAGIEALNKKVSNLIEVNKPEEHINVISFGMVNKM